MDLCFFHGQSITSSLIRGWTRSEWSHVEFEFSDGKHWGAHPNDAASGWRKVTEPCVTVGIPVEPWQEAQLREWCENESGCPYDWKGIFLSQIFNTARSTKNEWFCSEVCVAGLQYINKLPRWLKPCTFSPGELARIWGEACVP